MYFLPLPQGHGSLRPVLGSSRTTGFVCAAESAALVELLPTLPGRVVLVSNEVGMGIVPDNALARRFRDHAGRLHQSIAAVAPRVVLTVAGLPMFVKGTPV